MRALRKAKIDPGDYLKQFFVLLKEQSVASKFDEVQLERINKFIYELKINSLVKS